MVTAIEGNHMARSWCNGIYLKGSWSELYEDRTALVARPWYANPTIYADDFLIEIEEIIDESKPLTAVNLKKHRCTPADFAKALALMAQHSPQHFADFLQENEDIYTADVFLQYVALGEVVYG
jgi:hypothetical protein